MKKALALAVLATLSGAAVALAQPHGHRGFEQRFEKMDANHDGKLSKDELGAGLQRLFTEADANKDGRVTKDELAAMRGKRGGDGQHPRQHADRDGHGKHGGGFFAHLDANGDGAVDAAELKQAANTRFDRLDANHDGVVDKSELAAGRGRFGGRHCDGHGSEPSGGAAGTRG